MIYLRPKIPNTPSHYLFLSGICRLNNRLNDRLLQVSKLSDLGPIEIFLLEIKNIRIYLMPVSFTVLQIYGG